MPALTLQNFGLSFMGERQIQSVSFSFQGDAFCICGGKHAGKTPLCLALAGFNNPEGEITLNGKNVTNVLPENRNVGVLFGKAKLFRGTVGENIAYGLALRKDPLAREKAMETAQLLGLAEVFDCKAKKIKGVQAQKIAFARLLARRPVAVFADFPVRGQSAEELDFIQTCADLCKQRGILLIWFTENVMQAQLFSTLGILEKGTLTFFGSRADLRAHPPTPYAATFAEEHVNVLSGKKERGSVTVGDAALCSACGEGDVCCVMYEDFACITPTGIPCRLDYVERVGEKYRYYLDFSLKDEEIGGKTTRFTLLSEVQPIDGATTVYLTLNPQRLFVF